MKLLGLQIPFTKRTQVAIPDDRYFTLAQWMDGGKTEAGVDVTPDSALKFSAVMSCVRIISETLASIPLVVYKRKSDGSRSKAENHPLFLLLKNAPNPIQTSYQFREMLQLHILLRGNAYAQILRNAAGEVVQLWPLHPTKVEPELNKVTKEKQYRYRVDAGNEIILKADEVFHLQGLTDCGLKGLSPIAYARESIGLGLAAESHGGKFFKNNAVPAGFLKMEKDRTLSPEAAQRLKEQWDSQHSGGKATGKVILLEDGLIFEPATMSAEDAQYIQTREMQIREIARIFRVPPHMVGDLEKASYASIEQQSLEFLMYTMLPHFKRWEEAIIRDLLDGDDRRYFAEFMTNALLRGDAKTRMEMYVLGLQNAVFCPNDVRRKENEDPIGPEGDVYHVALNQVPLGKEMEVLAPQAAKPATKQPDPTPSDPAPKELPPPEKKSVDLSAFEPLFAEIWERILRKEQKSVRFAARKEGEKFTEWYATFRPEQREFAHECLRQAVTAFAGLRGESFASHEEAFNGLLERYCQRMDSDVTEFFAHPETGYELNELEKAKEMGSGTIADLVLAPIEKLSDSSEQA